MVGQERGREGASGIAADLSRMTLACAGQAAPDNVTS